jgi:hypothetical protein
MNKSLTAAAMAIAFGLPVASAQAMSEGEYKGKQDRIGAEYRAAQQKCRSLSGNAKDVCTAEAKGSEKVATAELGARRDNYTAEARHKVRITKAEAAHDVAKEKCDDLAGNARDVCVKDAKAALTRAKAEAGADHKASTTSQASREKVAKVTRAADYDAAVERCDSYAGEAKTRCVVETKARFGVK